MPARRLLLLDASRLTAWQWRSGRLRQEGEFSAHDAASPANGIEGFTGYLLANRASTWFLLADVAEEGFQIEDIPHVGGRDRADIIQRRLGLHFRGTPFSLALSLGRNREGRRDERLLLAALTRPEQFEPWLKALRQTESRLAGLFSMPQMVNALASRVGGEHRQFLLVSATRAGLRQTFIEDGLWRFSRLTLRAFPDETAIATASANEAANIHHYLSSHRLIAHGAAMPVRVLAHPAHVETFRNHCHDTRELRFEFINLVEAASKCGLGTLPKNSCGEELFLHLLAARTPRRQFAPAPERHLHRLQRLRFALHGAGFAALAASLLFAGGQAHEIDALSQESERMRGLAAGERQRYDAILKTLPEVPLSTENLRALTTRYEDLLRRGVGPPPLFIPLSHALRDSPEIDLMRLEWRLAHRPDAASESGDGRSNGGPFAVATLFGQLPAALVDNHRAQMDAIDALADRLRTQTGILEVTVLSRPFEVDSGKPLKSGGGAADGRAGTPKFSLRVIGK